jgi:hypothetical protein
MKSLVTQYHALNINELARGGWLYPFSKYDWVWRTNKGAHQTTATITVLKDSLQLLFAMGIHQRVLQDVQLTYSLGPRGGQRTWFRCPACPRRVGRAVSRGRPALSLSDMLQVGLSLPVPITRSKLRPSGPDGELSRTGKTERHVRGDMMISGGVSIAPPVN